MFYQCERIAGNKSPLTNTQQFISNITHLQLQKYFDCIYECAISIRKSVYKNEKYGLKKYMRDKCKPDEKNRRENKHY